MAENNSSGGIGVAGLLGVAFVVLKLTGHINWSWWWVTFPFWIPIAIGLLIILPIYLIAEVGKKRLEKRRTISKKSIFQQRLDEAMEQAEKAKR